MPLSGRTIRARPPSSLCSLDTVFCVGILFPLHTGSKMAASALFSERAGGVIFLDVFLLCLVSQMLCEKLKYGG